jgi:hypothetical protein
MGKLGRLGLEPAQRYERARPGELMHIEGLSDEVCVVVVMRSRCRVAVAT